MLKVGPPPVATAAPLVNVPVPTRSIEPSRAPARRLVVAIAPTCRRLTAPLPVAPGKRATNDAELSSSAPFTTLSEAATPFFPGAEGVYTRDTYRREPPLSKKLRTPCAR